MSQTYNLGKVAITPRGAYSSTAQYTPLDILTYNGSSYLVLQNCSGVTPPNATYYMVVASKGDTGSAGASPTIAAGTVTMTPAGTPASVTNVGTNVNASFNFTLPNGNVFYTGTSITGTETEPTVYADSGVTNAGVGDLYFNTSVGNFYKCIYGGDASTATWSFIANTVPNGSITTDKIADSAVTRSKIDDGAIGNDEIENGVVTLNKLGSNVTDVLDNKANVDGEYEQMTVGNAEQLVSTVGIADNAPYSFRTSGGSVDIGDRETDEVVGGTICWNQLFDETTEINLSVGSQRTKTTAVPVGSPIITGNKYLMLAEYSNAVNVVRAVTCSLYTRNNSSNKIVASISSTVSGKKYKIFESAYSGTSDGTTNINEGNIWIYSAMNASDTGASCDISRLQLFDLTKMFGSTIADYVYSLGDDGAYAWFENLFPNIYYANNSGSLMSVNTSAHNMVGFNAFDVDNVDLVSGNWAGGSTNGNVHTNNYIRVVPNSTYYLKSLQTSGTYIKQYDSAKNDINEEIKKYSSDFIQFTTSQNASYVRILWYVADGLTVNQVRNANICLNLHWDGEKDGDFEQYEYHSYPLDSSLTLRGIPKLDADNQLYYDGDTYQSDGTVTRNFGTRAYESGDESLADAITDGTNTVYKLTTPTTESATGFANQQIVSDWGTEQYVDYSYAQGTRDVEIPVGHNTLYSANLRAKLEMMPNSPSNGNGDYVVRQTDGINAYVPLVIPSELPNAPTVEGTYYLEATVDGEGNVTYAWQNNS